MRAAALALVGLACSALGAPAADLVDQMPDFDKVPFKVYSGYLNVPGPVAGYDALKIHYEFHECQKDPSTAPVATWHQGGPGGSSLYGAFAEMGYFQVSDDGPIANPYAWNRVANMLYLESPAGSGQRSGYSECIQGGRTVGCSWDDVSQGVAYAETLKAFFQAFPEYAQNDLYLTGESYAGQYLPNIAAHIVDSQLDNLPNFKGIAVGNGCWGGDANTVVCNGPHEEQDNLELFWGKGLISNKAYEAALAACYSGTRRSDCRSKLRTAMNEAGPYNIYNVYDNCPGQAEALEAANLTMSDLLDHHRKWLHDPAQGVQVLRDTYGGGYDWWCTSGQADSSRYLTRPDVQKALHLGTPGRSSFRYRSSGPASVTLYPDLIGKIRVLIFNGDADACVPYKGNQEWTTSMVDQGVVTEKAAWHPWYAPSGRSGTSVAAGYATTYTPVKGDKDFSFVTIRLAGHMVPQFQPGVALDMITNFLQGKDM